MTKWTNKLSCFLGLHKWLVIQRPVGEKSYRQCRHCAKEQQSNYNSMDYRTIWMDINDSNDKKSNS